MAAFVAKESNLLVIEPGSYYIKAGKADYQYAPAVRLLARLAKRTAKSSPADISYIVGKFLDEDLQRGVANQQDLIWPIQRGRITDWNAFERLIWHIVVRELQIKRAHNECPVLLAIPSDWGRDDLDRICQLMFEQINVPGLIMVDAALLAVYGCGVLSGIVIDIGHDTTTVTTVLDNVVVRHGIVTLPLGGRDVHCFLEREVGRDGQIRSEYGAEIDDAFVTALRESDLCELRPFSDLTKPPVLERVKRADFLYNGKSVTVGSYRLKAHEVLFDPSAVEKTCIGVAEAAYVCVAASVDADKRPLLWDNVVITGGVSCVKGLRDRLESELALFLAASETSNDFQAKEIKYSKIPEYYSAYKEKGTDATFLGGTIVAKLTLTSQGQYITKADYNELGPALARLKQ